MMTAEWFMIMLIVNCSSQSESFFCALIYFWKCLLINHYNSSQQQQQQEQQPTPTPANANANH
jgi:hypothetical protein